MTAPDDTPAGGATPQTYLSRYRCGACGARVDEHGGQSECEGWDGVSPLFAWALAASLDMLGDEWREMPDTIELPSVAARCAADPEFCRRMRESAHHLADRIGAGHADARLARCTADEVNLAIALWRTDSVLTDEIAGPVPKILEHATVDGVGADYNFASEYIRHDTDVEILWNPELDGAESDPTLTARMGLVHLHPTDWFEPYSHVNTDID